jgi:uncharacterized protein
MSNQDVFLEANKALAEGDYDAFISYCTDDVKWERVGEKTSRGKIELLEYISSAYDGLIFTTDNYIQEKDFIVELGQIIFQRMGESKRSSYCDIWNFRNGMIGHVRSFVI